MIYISNSNETLKEFKEKFENYYIVYIDCYQNKHSIHDDLIEAIFSKNFVDSLKKIYVFAYANYIPDKEITNLLKTYFNTKRKTYNPENKDIYLLNIDSIEDFNYTFKKYKKSYKYYNIENKQDGFFSTLKRIVNLTHDRDKLLNYKQIEKKNNIGLEYILRVINYNIPDSRIEQQIPHNLELLQQLFKFKYKIDSNSIFKILDYCYKPLLLRKLKLPPKKESIKPKKEQSKKISVNEAKEFVSIEFIEELEKRSPKIIETKNSIF